MTEVEQVPGRIEARIRRRVGAGSGALMPFIVAGHPTLEATAAMLPALEEAGADVIEIGFPFSDPIADGPVIAGAMHEALQGGVTPEEVMATVRSVRAKVGAGLIAMVSHSIVVRSGEAAFVEAAAAAGFDGLIVPDLDVDRADSLVEAVDAHALAFGMLIAPTTAEARLDRLVGLCRGFVYLLARVGLTGERAGVPDLGSRVEAIRARTTLPIAVGFGISAPDHVASVLGQADAAIVGSALVRRIGDAADPVAEAAAFVARLAAGRDRRVGPNGDG